MAFSMTSVRWTKSIVEAQTKSSMIKHKTLIDEGHTMCTIERE